MALCKSGQIANCCGPNALLTLQEYLDDYASEDTREVGLQLIKEQLTYIPNPKIRTLTSQRLLEVGEGRRDLHF